MADIYLKDRGGTPIGYASVQKIKVPKDSAAGSFDEFVKDGIIPSGTVDITENGTYDVTDKASAVVDVPTGVEKPDYLIDLGRSINGLRFNTFNTTNYMNSFLRDLTYPTNGIVELLKTDYEGSQPAFLYAMSLSITTDTHVSGYMMYLTDSVEPYIFPVYSTVAFTASISGNQVHAKEGWNRDSSGISLGRVNYINDSFDIDQIVAQYKIAFGDFYTPIPSGTLFIRDTESHNVTNYSRAQVSDGYLMESNIKHGVSILGKTGSYYGDIPPYCIRPGVSMRNICVNPDYSISGGGGIIYYFSKLPFEDNKCMLISSNDRDQNHKFEIFVEIDTYHSREIYSMLLYRYSKLETDEGTIWQEVSRTRLFGQNETYTDYVFDKPYNFSVAVTHPYMPVVDYMREDLLSFVDSLFAKSDIAFGKHYPELQNKSIVVTENGITFVNPDSGYDGLQQVSISTQIPQPSGSLYITENGTYDVTDTASAVVAVPEPTSRELEVSEAGNYLPSDYDVDYFSAVTVSGLGKYTIITIDAEAGVFTHPLITSPYIPRALFMAQDGFEFMAGMSGLYVDGSALGMPSGFLSCIGWSQDSDRTAWYSAKFINGSGEEAAETTANARLVFDTDAHTITVTYIESDGMDLTPYVPMASLKLWLILPAVALP